MRIPSFLLLATLAGLRLSSAEAQSSDTLGPAVAILLGPRQIDLPGPAIRLPNSARITDRTIDGAVARCLLTPEHHRLTFYVEDLGLTAAALQRTAPTNRTRCPQATTPVGLSYAGHLFTLTTLPDSILTILGPPTRQVGDTLSWERAWQWLAPATERYAAQTVYVVAGMAIVSRRGEVEYLRVWRREGT